MSNQNNEANGAVVGLVLIGAAMWMMFALIFAIASFAAVIFTILAFFAWNKPLTIFGQTIHPHEARAFVGRGLIGMILLPVFVIFACAMFKVGLTNEVWPYLLGGGYTLGSVGIEFLMAKAAEERAANATYIPPAPAPLPPQKKPAQQAREPFTFASWDDEEKPR